MPWQVPPVQTSGESLGLSTPGTRGLFLGHLQTACTVMLCKWQRSSVSTALVTALWSAPCIFTSWLHSLLNTEDAHFLLCMLCSIKEWGERNNSKRLLWACVLSNASQVSLWALFCKPMCLVWQLLTFARHCLMKARTVLVVIPFLLELNGVREKRGTPQVVSSLSCSQNWST